MGDLPLLTGRSPFWPGGGLTSQKENRSLQRVTGSEKRGTHCSLERSIKSGKADIPKGPFRSHTEILHNKPDANLILGVVQSESASRAVSNKISRKHALNT